MVSAGEVIRASDVAVQAARVTRTAVQSLTDNTETTVLFDAELFDTNAMHDTVTNNSRLTINTAGIYVLGFNGTVVAGSDYSRIEVALRINGTTEIARVITPATTLGVQRQTFAVATVYQFVVGDYVEVRVIQDNSASASRNLEVTADRSPEFWAARIGS